MCGDWSGCLLCKWGHIPHNYCGLHFIQLATPRFWKIELVKTKGEYGNTDSTSNRTRKGKAAISSPLACPVKLAVCASPKFNC